MLYFILILIGIITSGALFHLWWWSLSESPWNTEELVRQSLDRSSQTQFAPRQIQPKRKKVEKTKRSKLSLNVSPSSGQSCPLCWEVIHSCVFYCDDCKTLYHADCIEEMSSDGKCVTSGCTKQFNVKRANRV